MVSNIVGAKHTSGANRVSFSKLSTTCCSTVCWRYCAAVSLHVGDSPGQSNCVGQLYVLHGYMPTL